MAKTKAVAYLRVACVDESKGNPFATQMDTINKYAAENNMEIIETFQEAPPEIKNQKQFQRMISFLGENRSVKVVLAEKGEHLYRSVENAFALDPGKMGIEIHLIAEGVRYTKDSNPNDRLALDIKLLLASHYRRHLSEQIKKGILNKKERR